MRKPLVAGLALTTLITHGMVSTGMNLSDPHPAWTYEGFFQQIILGIGQIYGPPDFGHFIAHAVRFAAPVLGFLAFLLISRQKPGVQTWKPLAIAIAFTTPLHELITHPLLASGVVVPLTEVLRSAIVLILMVSSLRALPSPTRQPLLAQNHPV